MLTNTKAVGNKIKNDLRIFSGIYSISAQLIYVLFLVYTLISGIGILALNIALLALSVAFEAFLTISFIKRDFLTREHNKLIKRAFRITSLTLKAISLGIGIYGIHISITSVNTVSLIFTVLMFFGWLSSVLIELLRFVIEGYVNLSVAAVKNDIEPLVKIYHKITFKSYERETSDEDEKVRKIADVYRAELKEKEEAKKTLKKAERIIKKDKKREASRKRKAALKSKFSSLFKKDKKSDTDKNENKE